MLAFSRLTAEGVLERVCDFEEQVSKIVRMVVIRLLFVQINNIFLQVLVCLCKSTL